MKWNENETANAKEDITEICSIMTNKQSKQGDWKNLAEI